MKRLVACFLAALILLAMTACGTTAPPASQPSSESAAPTATADASTEEPPAAGSGYPDYLNLQGERPVIKEGEGSDVVIKMAINQPSNGGDWDDLWIAKYYKEYLNMNFDVEQILDSALAERKNLMFASGDLPDIMLNLGLSTSEIVKYGQMEGQLLKLDEYIDQALTPGILYWFNQQPEARAMASTPDGHVYTLPKLSDKDDEGLIPRLFINKTWLDACSMEIPRTLDEFTAMARAFKEKDPAGVGSENVIPIGGGVKALNLGYYVLNAMGYVGGDSGLHAPRIRNGEVDIPCGSAELFKAYLGIMKGYYDEGLISKDYFVTDATEINAQLNAGRIGVYGQPVYVTGVQNWADWVAAYPLTSQWNDKPVWKAPDTVTVGGFAVSAKTEYAEACLRFADCYFGEDSRVLWVGPVDGSEDAMGYLGQTKNKTWGDFWDETKFPEGISDLWSYLMGYLGPMPQFGAYDLRVSSYYYQVNRKGFAEASMEKTFDLTNADQQYRATVYENLMPSISESFPNVYYLDEETTTRLSDLSAVIQPYVEEQAALFISGERSLDEFDAYLSELKAINFDEYLQIYKDIWAGYKKAMS